MKGYLAIGFMACCLLNTGCAYLDHRARDASDMVTLAGEDQTISCVARVMFPLGISLGQGDGFGLREGYIGSYEYREIVLMLPPISNNFTLEFRPEDDYRNKAYGVASPGCQENFFWAQWLSVQVSVGFYYGVRAGVNLAEVLDFMLGWTTLDFMQDDKGPHPSSAKTAACPSWSMCPKASKSAIGSGARLQSPRRSEKGEVGLTNIRKDEITIKNSSAMIVALCLLCGSASKRPRGQD